MSNDFALDSVDKTVAELIEQLSADADELENKIKLTVESLNIYREEMSKIDEQRNNIMNAIRKEEEAQEALASELREKESTIEVIKSMIEEPEIPIIPTDPVEGEEDIEEPSIPLIPLKPVEDIGEGDFEDEHDDIEPVEPN